MAENLHASQGPAEAEAIIIIKAAPHVSQKHGETVCCAGIDLHGNWLRLFPISFRGLEDEQKFGRWDRVKFRCRLPDNDPRNESRRVEQRSITVVGTLKQSERERFLANKIVTSLDREREAGRSLALLRAEIVDFKHSPKGKDEIEIERREFAALAAQHDLFQPAQMIPYQPCPHKFKFKYRTDDGVREGTCQDWEMEATYFKWSKEYGEEEALGLIQKVFGEDYPKKGMLLAMGTHSKYPDTWLINGIVRLDEVRQLSLI
jgi:hypothetical protein